MFVLFLLLFWLNPMQVKLAFHDLAASLALLVALHLSWLLSNATTGQELGEGEGREGHQEASRHGW